MNLQAELDEILPQIRAQRHRDAARRRRQRSLRQLRADLDARAQALDEREARLSATQRRLAKLGWWGVLADLLRSVDDEEIREKAAVWREGLEVVRVKEIVTAAGHLTDEEVREKARVWWRECRGLERTNRDADPLVSGGGAG